MLFFHDATTSDFAFHKLHSPHLQVFGRAMLSFFFLTLFSHQIIWDERRQGGLRFFFPPTA